MSRYRQRWLEYSREKQMPITASPIPGALRRWEISSLRGLSSKRANYHGSPVELTFFWNTKSIFIRTDKDNAFAANCYRLGVRLLVVHGLNISVYENEVDILGRMHARC
jgi:hypothetical protein